MNRRNFVQVMAGVGAVTSFRVPLANAANYRGKLFVFVQADGGWDPTSFCDPKANVAGEPVINNWAASGEIRQAGNIRYAPFGKNQAFFEKYYQRILVVNGVDAQTNSHTVGVTHNWSGRISDGYPTTTALLAAHNGTGLSMPYLTFGGFSYTAGVTVFTRLNNPSEVRNIAKPDLPAGDSTWPPFFSSEDWASFTRHRDKRIARLAAAPNLMPRDARNRELYAAALSPDAVEGLRAFADTIPNHSELAPVEEFDVYRSSLKRQAQLTVLSFKAGVAVSADLRLGGFDTHDNHDPDQNWLLGNLTDSIDYLWDFAELHGVADRMVVVMGSDFGRTNKYNSDLGKDHWPIGSFIIMEKNQGWTNRVIGETDELHFAYKVDPGTLQRNDAAGTRIHPKHIHKALRKYLGVGDTANSLRFPFNNTEELPLFS
ncbi:MAG: DUF1501 domain-containing protein [Bryobacterales bacterium]|nr:DUF1501 domain-containing protein [Bryobacterales bacterium]